MNILYITNHLNVGGITSYVFSLAAGMKSKGHNVFIASSGGDLLAKFRDKEVSFIPIPIRTKQELSPGIFVSAFKLASAIRKYDISIVHTNSRTTQVLGCLLERFSGVVHISTCHGFFKPRIFRKIFPCWGRKVIAISQQVKEHLMQDFKVKEKDIIVINNGIDLNRFKVRDAAGRALRKRELGLGDGPVVGIVARLSDIKGHAYLIEAMGEVIKKNAQAQLLIVGEGKMKQELVNLVKSLHIEENVFFVPSVDDTNKVLSAMDIFVMPSIKEGLGLALMEAMACGLSVIGSRVGGIKTLIENGVNGLLTKPADANALSEGISELLRNQQKSQALGINARVFINQNFSQDKMIDETERLYSQCLS